MRMLSLPLMFLILQFSFYCILYFIILHTTYSRLSEAHYFISFSHQVIQVFHILLIVLSSIQFPFTGFSTSYNTHFYICFLFLPLFHSTVPVFFVELPTYSMKLNFFLTLLYCFIHPRLREKECVTLRPFLSIFFLSKVFPNKPIYGDFFKACSLFEISL